MRVATVPHDARTPQGGFVDRMRQATGWSAFTGAGRSCRSRSEGISPASGVTWATGGGRYTSGSTSHWLRPPSRRASEPGSRSVNDGCARHIV